MTPCANPACGRLHSNKTYCSHPCRNTTENRKKFAACQQFGINLRRAKFHAEMARMIARCRYYGQTEDARLVLAWRYGLGASKTRRYRLRKAS